MEISTLEKLKDIITDYADYHRGVDMKTFEAITRAATAIEEAITAKAELERITELRNKIDIYQQQIIDKGIYIEIDGKKVENPAISGLDETLEAMEREFCYTLPDFMITPKTGFDRSVNSLLQRLCSLTTKYLMSLKQNNR